MTENQDAFKMTADEQSVLDLCIEVEQTCAELYRYFERVFEQDKELSNLWAKTAEEEDDHAEQFRVAARLKGVGIQGVRNDSAMVTTVLNKIRDFMERDDVAPTPVEALSFALAVEEELSEFHMDSVLNFEDKRLEQVFLTQVRCVKGHVSELRKALRRLKRRRLEGSID